MMVSELNPSLNKPKVYKIKRVKSKVVNRGITRDPKNYMIAGVEFTRCDQDKSIIQSTFVPEVYQNDLNTNSWNRNFTMMRSFLELFVNTYEETKFRTLDIYCDKNHGGGYYRMCTTPGNGQYFTEKDLSICYDDFNIHQIPEYKSYTGKIHMSVILMYSNARSKYICICVPYMKDLTKSDYSNFIGEKSIYDINNDEITYLSVNDMSEKICEYFSKAYCMDFFSLTKRI